MKFNLFLLVVFISGFCFSSEWSSLKTYQKATGNLKLTKKDWLKSDRRKNTQVWQDANVFNLNNLQAIEYQTIAQRRDFYKWYYLAISKKGHTVVWPKMAHYISKKLKLINTFPFCIFTRKTVKNYAYLGSETVFNAAFKKLKDLYFQDAILTHQDAEDWDLDILYSEQYMWLQTVYSQIDARTLKTLSKMAKGVCFYTLMVPKEIEFEGHLEIEKDRFKYAKDKLKPYCKRHY